MTVYKLTRIAKDKKENTVEFTDNELNLIYFALDEFRQVLDEVDEDPDSCIEECRDIIQKLFEVSQD